MTQQEESFQDAITSLTTSITGNQALLAAYQAALTLLQNGYQSDADAIAAAVATQVGDVQTANATLTAQVADLTSQLGTANSTISSITTILANLGYNSDGTPIA